VSHPRRAFGLLLRRAVPPALKAQVGKRFKARVRALLGIEPWPDLAVRLPLFRTPEFQALRAAARAFDIEKPSKPVLERGHQASYVVAKWLKEGGVRSAFHVGFANGRYLFYLQKLGIACGGVDLPAEDTRWADIPPGALDDATMRRLVRRDFLALTEADVRPLWGPGATVDVVFSEATFETMLPWRAQGASVPRYLALSADARRALLEHELPDAVARMKDWARNMTFIEPEPAAGESGAVFAACAARLADFQYSVWAFRPPLDQLFRLSAYYPTRQTVYAFTRDARLLEALTPYAERVR
jgi:hypothetical protein